MWTLLTTSPAEFRDGAIWQTIVTINDALKAFALALLVLFFFASIFKTVGNMAELKRPELIVKMLIRFVLARAVVIYGMDLMLAVFEICQGIMATIGESIGAIGAEPLVLPDAIRAKILDTGFFERIPMTAVALIGSLGVTIMSFVLILTVYGRFFKLYMYTAIAPIPLASFAGESTESTGKAFLRSYIGVCMEGAIIMLAMLIFNGFAISPPDPTINVGSTQMIWNYISETIFNFLVLVIVVKGSDHITKEMLGLSG